MMQLVIALACLASASGKPPKLTFGPWALTVDLLAWHLRPRWWVSKITANIIIQFGPITLERA